MQELVRAAHADPTDRAARRALADALLAEGDAAGELLALGLELEEQTGVHPRWKARQQDVRERHERARAAWRARLGLTELGFDVGWQGLIELAGGRASAWFADLERFLAWVPECKLLLVLEPDDADSRSELERLQDLEALQAVRELVLGRGSVESDCLARFLERAPLTSLRVLRIDPAYCVGQLGEALGRARLPKSLRELELNGFNSEIGDAQATALIGAPWIGQLEALSLKAVGLTEASMLALANAELNLRRLDLQDGYYTANDFHADGLHALAEAPWVDRLRELNLSRAGPLGEAVSHLFSHAAELEVADLSQLGIGPTQLAAMTATPAWERLRVLHLDGNPLRDAGARILARAPRLPADLSLAGCGLRAEGLDALGDSPKFRVLRLHGNAIDEECWSRVLRAGRPPKAREIWIAAGGFSAELLEELGESYADPCIHKWHRPHSDLDEQDLVRAAREVLDDPGSDRAWLAYAAAWTKVLPERVQRGARWPHGELSRLQVERRRVLTPRSLELHGVVQLAHTGLYAPVRASLLLGESLRDIEHTRVRLGRRTSNSQEFEPSANIEDARAALLSQTDGTWCYDLNAPSVLL